MAFDAFPESAALAPPPARLATVGALKARALYTLARTTGAGVAYEAAAHALAGALEAAEAALGAAQAAAKALDTLQGDKPPRAKRKAATAGDACEPLDLAAALRSPPKSKARVGAFHCIWADGSCTFVSGVLYHGDKPDSRWGAAFQAADRLRRIRARREYAASLNTPWSALGDTEIVGAAGVRQLAPAWLELLQVRPMPALAEIVDEAGECFAPAGAFGAGDEARARELEAALVTPCNPHQAAILRREGHHPSQAADGLAVYRSERQFAAFPTGWTPMRRQVRQLEALEAFAPTTDEETAEAPRGPATAEAGAPISPASLHDVDGAEVVINRDLVAAHIEMQRRGELDIRDSLWPLHGAAGDEGGALVAYRLRRGTGGFTFTLTDTTGRQVRFGADRLPYLAQAQPTPSNPAAQ